MHTRPALAHTHTHITSYKHTNTKVQHTSMQTHHTTTPSPHRRHHAHARPRSPRSGPCVRFDQPVARACACLRPRTFTCAFTGLVNARAHAQVHRVSEAHMRHERRALHSQAASHHTSRLLSLPSHTDFTDLRRQSAVACLPIARR